MNTKVIEHAPLPDGDQLAESGFRRLAEPPTIVRLGKAGFWSAWTIFLLVVLVVFVFPDQVFSMFVNLEYCR